jgi:hypothetical protein
VPSGSKVIHCREQAVKAVERPINQLNAGRIMKQYRPPMTSLKRIDANRRNSLKSTGPKTEAGF